LVPIRNLFLRFTVHYGTTVTSVIARQTCTSVRSSFAPTLVVSPVVEQEIHSDDPGRRFQRGVNRGSYHPDSRATGGIGGRFSDGRYLDTHRADKDAFYVWRPDPLLLHRSQRRTSCSWTALAFSSAVNTGREGLD
jgi:hypothetical protein